TRLYLGTAPVPPPQQQQRPDTPPAAGQDQPEDDRVQLDLWHWRDDYIQPMQKVRAEQERRKSYLAVYELKPKKFRQLADEALPQVTVAETGRWAVGTDDRAYRRLVGYGPNLADVYLVDTFAGTRKPLRKAHEGPVTISPGNRYALYFDGTDWR